MIRAVAWGLNLDPASSLNQQRILVTIHPKAASYVNLRFVDFDPGLTCRRLGRAEGFDESADAFDEHLSERAERSALQSEDRNLMADIREFNG